jgi:hypothetical protein
MEIIKCDKCKKIKKSEQGKSSFRSKWTSGNVRGGNPWEMISFDLCEKCSQGIVKFIKTYLRK